MHTLTQKSSRNRSRAWFLIKAGQAHLVNLTKNYFDQNYYSRATALYEAISNLMKSSEMSVFKLDWKEHDYFMDCGFLVYDKNIPEEVSLINLLPNTRKEDD